MTIIRQRIAETDQIRPIQLLPGENQDSLPAPLVRVSTCGLLTVEILEEIINSEPPTARYVSLTPEQLRGRGTAPALLLLKLLAGNPHRFASRDWLLAQFCRDDEVFSTVRIDNIVSILRGLLCPPAYEEWRTKLVGYVRSRSGNGDGYQLAAYPLIWVDHEALNWQVEQAVRMERFGEDGLPFWERAYALAKRGMYLPDEMYSDWATARRGEVLGMLRQSVQALGRMYVERYGKAGEEEALLLLRSYWHEHSQEEDVLRPLMELLGRRECFHEALEYYEQLCKILEAEECQPDAQTQDVAAFLRAKQIQRPRVVQQVISQEDRITRQSQQPAMSTAFVPFPLGKHEYALPSPCEKSSEMLLLPPGINPLITSSPEVIQDSFRVFEDVLEAARELSQGSKLKTAETVLWSWLPKFAIIARQFPEHQRKAASLAAQGYILAAPLASHHNGNLSSRQFLSEQALYYAQMAQEPNVYVAALRALGVTFDYQKRPLKALQAYQQTLPYLGRVSTLLHARMCALLAGAYAKIGKRQEAFDFIGKAYDTFPERPQDDPSYRYVDAGAFTLVIWDGAVHLHTQQPKQALEVFLRARKMYSQQEELPHRIQSELFIYQTHAFTMLGDLEAASIHLMEAINAALALQSEIRYQQAYGLFSQLQTVWPNEPRVRSLRELFLR